jgi:hypothetical protein
MLHKILFSLALILFCAVQVSYSQGKKSIKKVPIEPKIHFCPVDFTYNPHYVPERKVPDGKNFQTEFVITYEGPVTEVARDALENGVLPIISDLVNSPVPIHIAVDWRALDGNALAGASPGGYYTNIPTAPNPDQIYPVALAEKIIGFDINLPDAPDINITVNSTANWYYDYNNPSGIGNRFDFVSVLLHEIIHGMGFTAVVGVNDDNLGFIRVFEDDRFTIYTDFIFDNGDVKLTDYPDGSTLLGIALQGNNLFFNLISSNNKAKLFAPDTWDPGSSVSHVDEVTYNNTTSSLMTPSASPGTVERDPGIALDMLYDMGWDMTYLMHSPVPGKEDLDEDVLLEIEVISDSPFDESSLAIHWSRDGFLAEDEVAPLVRNDATGMFEYSLPAPNEELTYQYYFQVENSRNIQFTNPGQAPQNFYEFRYAVDTEPPTVSHRSPREINDVAPQFTVEAVVSDAYLGVESATITWSINGIDQEPVAMERQPGFSITDETDNYEGTLVFPNGPLVEGDIVQYQITAIDKSKAQNSVTAPLFGNWRLEVIPVEEALTSYVNDFNLETDDFDGAGFSEIEVAGFSDAAIHSTHPYPEAGQGNFRNLVYELTIPLIIEEEEPLIKFDEIVLVELGEPNTRYGDDEFWDYVIIEGQRVGESTWLPFIDGYDSNANSAWRNAYNNGQAGTPSLFFPRTINMTANGNFNPGDEVFIRFRLFSDPFVNAWGWAIDNLKIQEKTTAVEDFVLEENFIIRPNPVDQDEVTVELSLESVTDGATIRLMDLYGRQLAVYPIDQKSRRVAQRISLSELPAGIYVVNVVFNDRDLISRKLVKN